MPSEENVVNINEVKTTSDGVVKIAVEKYNEMIETIASQKSSIIDLRRAVTEARVPPVINQTIVEKTPQMLAKEHKAWGNTFIGLGVSMVAIGVFHRRAEVPEG